MLTLSTIIIVVSQTTPPVLEASVHVTHKQSAYKHLGTLFEQATMVHVVHASLQQG